MASRISDLQDCGRTQLKGYIGTNFGHGSSAALVNDEGNLVCAVEEGKLIGQKETSRFPEASLRYIGSRAENHSLSWAEGWHCGRRLVHKGFLRAVKYGLRDSTYVKRLFRKELGRYQEGVCKFGSLRKRFGKVQYVSHHLAHAYSLVAAGLPAKSLVLVSDTTGEIESISSFYFTGEKMVHVRSSSFPHSIGAVFHQLAYHVGFGGRTGPGKLMALAGLGEPRYLDVLDSIGEVNNGEFRIDIRRFPAWKWDGAWELFAESQSGEFRTAIHRSRMAPDDAKDIAASAQSWFTETTWKVVIQSLHLVRSWPGTTVDHLGLSGGAALNCHANGVLWKRIDQVGLESIVVGPWSDDPGTAIGAAIWAYGKEGGSMQCVSSSQAYLGPTPEVSLSRGPEGVREAIDAISKDGIVALVTGPLEFGPRALGGRCLLADPRRDESRQRLNRIKSRPEFMPVAPAVLEDSFCRYFHGVGSPFMAWTVDAKNKACLEIPAAVHENGSSRVQIVRKNSCPLLEALLGEFERVTGHPVLLLTSLNEAGEAVPVWIEPAMELAEKLGIDGVVCDAGWFPVGAKLESQLV